ncbi:rhomboid family intramembrane serine protease [Natrononativus amylolyticus]|uniref:rhomboid family intramembrane serine protease n=1 Tax=Natrononativus amylolyticus TaxID=2963434 RepID=UPI0020CEA988|nr:rhomboid family intramembrane serine protease [Natrononativus amylolyticus]
MSDGSGGNPILETLGLFVLVFVLQAVAYVIGAAALMTGLFVLSPPLDHSPWTIVTSVYAHSGIGHLISNSIGLIVFGWPIARATTRLRFHTFFILTGAFAGVTHILVTEFLLTLSGGGQTPGVLGASGAVFALMGYLIAGNRLSDGIAARIEVPWWMTLLVFLILAAVVTIATGAPGVALIAHFAGFLVGLLAGRAGVLEPERRRQRAGQRSI